jgi:hypothetical protein
MPGKSHLKSLEARKNLLLAESELNRVHLIQEWDRMKQEVHLLVNPVKTAARLAATAAKFGLLFSLWRRIRRPTAPAPASNTNHRSSLRPFVLNLYRGMKTGISLWQTLRPRR